jgi:long-chain-fatty-acid--CoA ligase ACSBG
MQEEKVQNQEYRSDVDVKHTSVVGTKHTYMSDVDAKHTPDVDVKHKSVLEHNSDVEKYTTIYPSLLPKTETDHDHNHDKTINTSKYLELKQTTDHDISPDISTNNVDTTSTIDVVDIGLNKTLKTMKQTQEESSTKSLTKYFFSLENSNKTAMVSYSKKQDLPRVYTWREYVVQAKNFAMYLTEETKGNVAIHSFNCPEWFIAAMGSICTGSIHGQTIPRFFCGIYNTNRDEQCMHIIKTGKCDTLVVESYAVLREYYKNVIDQLVKMEINIIVIDSTGFPTKSQTESKNNLSRSNINTELWENLKIRLWEDLKLEAPTTYKEYPINTDKNNSNDICTLIFTSGTTGNPKAVEITHQNIFTTMEGVLDKIKLSSCGDRIVSYLPLSHIAGQAIDLYTPIFVHGETHFANSNAMKGTLKDTLLMVRPTLFFGVPRVWEKFKEGLEKVSEKKYSNGIKGGLLKGFMNIVKSVEKNYNVSGSYCKQVSLYPLSAISSRIVNKIKEQLGLDKCKYFATGAAPISREVLEYFASIGICILELYGMSETCGIITVSTPIDTIQGSCGSAIKNVEVKIGKNDEILVKGSNVFNKYYGYEGSNEIDEKGYLHTGDCGRIDCKGNLYITGRIKELLITAGGENIPPVLIEDNIKSLFNKHKNEIKNENKSESKNKNDIQIQPVLIGDKKKYLSLLIFLSSDSKSNEMSENSLELDSSLIKNIIEEYNLNFAISNSQKIQKYKIIGEGMSIDNGLLTPTMKIKRSEVIKRYVKIIDEIYAESE